MYAVEYWVGSNLRKANPRVTGPMDDAASAARSRAELMDSGFVAEVVRSPFTGSSGVSLHGGEKLSIHGQRR